MEEATNNLPRRCGRYVLLERLGGGGMAEVYKARLAQSDGPDRVLVVKLLPPNANPTAAARFIDEAKIALPLTHGNITATFEFGKAESRPFLVMEYVHGRSLRQALSALERRGETMSVPTGIFLGREVARALRYAHRFVDVESKRAPIVHRDVSPENVLVSFSGQVKLTDFGIARSTGALDIAGAWGKPAYVAPEILEGDPGSPSSDVYSLGCVIFEVISGWPPLIGKTEEETLDLVRTTAPVRLDTLRDDVPTTLSDMIANVLEKDPKSRTIDAASLEVALARLLAELAPHFTEAEIAGSMVRLFEDSRPSNPNHDEAFLADRLREQLSDAGVEITGRESASEMLALGTVQLSPPPPVEPIRVALPLVEGDTTLKIQTSDIQRPTRYRRRRTQMLVALVVVLALAIGFGVARWLPGLGGTPFGDTIVSGGVADAGVPDTRDAAPLTGDSETSVTAPETDGAASSDGDAQDASKLRDTQDGSQTKISRPRRPATVTFNSHPWSYVFVNGRKLPGFTPLRNVKLPPGQYRVRFVNPELKLSQSTVIRVGPGETQFVRMKLKQSGKSQ